MFQTAFVECFTKTLGEIKIRYLADGVTSAVIINRGFGFAPSSLRAVLTMIHDTAIALASTKCRMLQDGVSYREFLHDVDRHPKAVGLVS